MKREPKGPKPSPVQLARQRFINARTPLNFARYALLKAGKGK